MKGARKWYTLNLNIYDCLQRLTNDICQKFVVQSVLKERADRKNFSSRTLHRAYKTNAALEKIQNQAGYPKLSYFAILAVEKKKWPKKRNLLVNIVKCLLLNIPTKHSKMFLPNDFMIALVRLQTIKMFFMPRRIQERNTKSKKSYTLADKKHILNIEPPKKSTHFLPNCCPTTYSMSKTIGDVVREFVSCLCEAQINVSESHKNLAKEKHYPLRAINIMNIFGHKERNGHSSAILKNRERISFRKSKICNSPGSFVWKLTM